MFYIMMVILVGFFAMIPLFLGFYFSLQETDKERYELSVWRCQVIHNHIIGTFSKESLLKEIENIQKITDEEIKKRMERPSHVPGSVSWTTERLLELTAMEDTFEFRQAQSFTCSTGRIVTSVSLDLNPTCSRKASEIGEVISEARKELNRWFPLYIKASFMRFKKILETQHPRYYSEYFGEEGANKGLLP